MIPKIGDMVYVSEKFIEEIDKISDIAEDFKQWVKGLFYKKLEVTSVNFYTPIYNPPGYIVNIKDPLDWFTLDENGYYESFYNTPLVPFLTYNKPTKITQQTVNIYCCCSKPQIKDVYIMEKQVSG
jgi:hypothetical protein